jgi:YDG domain
MRELRLTSWFYTPSKAVAKTRRSIHRLWSRITATETRQTRRAVEPRRKFHRRGFSVVVAPHPQTISQPAPELPIQFRVNPPAGTASGNFTGAINLTTTNGGAESFDLCLTVPAAVNTTTTASNASATYGDSSATLNATVTPASGPAVNAGTVTFTVKKGATTIGTVTSGTVTGGSASASFPLSGVNADTYTIEAAYNAGPGFNASNNSTQSPPPTLTVDQKTVTGSFTADNKVYDGGTSATILTRSLTGKVGTDDVSLSGGSATFANKHVGTGKTVTGTGFSLTGAKANNYILASSTLTTTADITARAITVTAAPDSKVYDGTTSSNGTPTVTTGSLVGTDKATFTQSFDNKNVGQNKTLTPSGSVNDGNSGNNYNITFVDYNNGEITARSITVTAVPDTKVYDGTTSSNGTPQVTPSGSIASGDTATFTQSFDNKNVGTGKTLTPSGSVSDGNNGDNYDVTFANNNNGQITAKALTASFTATNKVYDGNMNATITGSSITGGVVTGDPVGISHATATATFDNPNVGTGKTVTGTGFTRTGLDKDNYKLPDSLTTTANITAWNAQGSGFYAPVGTTHSIFVAAPGTPPANNNAMDLWNTVKGGSTVPLKFSVYAGTVEKTSLSDIKGLTAQQLRTCSTDQTAVNDPVDFTSTETTSLRYDTTAKQWIQNWKTSKVTSDTCYRATVTFADGSSISAFFKLLK